MSKEEKSFEEKLSELEVIVNELESGNVDLDNAINKYTDAMKIAGECSKKLEDIPDVFSEFSSGSNKRQDL